MNPVRRRLRAVGGGCGVLVVGAVLAACGSSAPTLEVDGWATGALLSDCTTSVAAEDCARMVTPALSSLDDGRERRSIKVYEEGPYIDASGAPRRLDRGQSPLVIVVVTYTDGTRRAAGVACAATIEGQPPPACTVSKPPFD